MSAPEIRLAALCDHALVGQDGKLSLLGIFRNISVSRLPAQHPRMFLVAVLTLEPGEHSVVVRLRRPDGTAAMADVPQMKVHASAGQDVNLVVELNNLSFGSYGQHRFDLEIDGDAVGALEIGVTAMPKPQKTRVN